MLHIKEHKSIHMDCFRTISRQASVCFIPYRFFKRLFRKHHHKRRWKVYKGRSNESFKKTYYTLPFKDLNRIHHRSVIETNTTGIIESVNDIGGDSQIHIIFYYKELEPDFNEPPFTFNNTIRIIVDETIPESPKVQNDGHFVIWEDDLMSPLLMNMLIEKINSILC